MAPVDASTSIVDTLTDDVAYPTLRVARFGDIIAVDNQLQWGKKWQKT